MSDARAGEGLTLTFDIGARAVIAHGAPTASSAPISEDWLRQRLGAEGWGAFRTLPTAVNLLLASFNKGATIEALRIAEAVDAAFDVNVSDDGMLATLSLSAPQGGMPVSSEDVIQHLAELGIVAGYDQVALAEAINAGVADHLVIARGREPEHGTDGFLEPLLPLARNRSPKVNESGQVDYREQGEIVVVHPGDVLMRRHPPGAGVAGRTLLGVSIPARAGKAVMFAANLAGTSFSPDDPDLLIAAITGQPVVVRGGMMVEPVFVVEEVTLATGNIRFDGTVVVRGDVGTGMSVHATGDIEVGGVVELATLDAGNCIHVKGGVIGGLGRKESNVGSIRCAGSCEVGYAQNARIEAGDCVVVDDTAMNCELIAVNHIVAGPKKRGCIVGGRHQATLSVTAKVIGNPQRTATIFEIGVNPATHKLMLDLAKDRDAKETGLQEVGKLLAFAAQHPGKLPAATVAKAQQTADALNAAVADLHAQYEALNTKLGLSSGARVIALQQLHEGVEVRMGERRFRVPSEFTECAVGLDRKGNLGLLAVDESEDDPSL